MKKKYRGEGKPFRLVSQDEINEVIKDKCRKCYYCMKSSTTIANNLCDYAGITGQIRGGTAFECQHYKDHKWRRRKKDNAMKVAYWS